ncbi:unnamed protein product [Ostreobium quekettii]|uniref:Ammonium transporter AmtB-like domain-containing protein n=1 Tax=Ostreobium quekettii TaxID=121088 RepID=A0A8S1JCC7_9CHLO|nr:unnamed protein product [Ostreobium quekettii]
MARGGLAAPLLGRSQGSASGTLRKVFGSISGLCLLILLILFFVFVRYSPEDADVDVYYMWYIHVAIMIWVGFGFLMTFLHHYSLGAVCLNFFASCFITLEAAFVIGSFYYSDHHEAGSWLVVDLNLPLLIEGLFAAAAGMISFGAVLGKVSPAQLLLLMVLEVPFYAVNNYFIIDQVFSAKDVGGSMGIHAFGAYFGLAATLFLSRKGTGSSHTQNRSNYTSDVTSMIGTIFLWIFWPSFNATMAMPGPFSSAIHDSRFTAVVNTIVSLSGACLATFMASALVDGKFNVVHIQNATLAGGVAMGSAADLSDVGPGGALAIGMVAGILSVMGFKYIGPVLEKWVGLKDTRGVHNLHGLPGLLGGVAAAVVMMVNGDWHGFGYQLLALLVTFNVAILGGAVSGALSSLVDRLGTDDAVNAAFNDQSAFSIEV